MKKIVKLRWLFAVVLVAGGTFGKSRKAKQKPNIIFILADDLGINSEKIYFQKIHFFRQTVQVTMTCLGTIRT